MRVANRELGTVQSFTDDGRMSLQMDNGQSVSIDPREHPHLDHGNAVTSHSSHGQTAARVLINIDTEVGAKRPHQQPNGLGLHLAWSVRRTDLYQRPRETARSAQLRYIAPERPCSKDV